MSAQKRSDLQALYGSSGSQLPDNTSGDITPNDLRSLGQDITDSEFNLIDDAYSGAKGFYLNITNTTGLKAIVTVGMTNGVIVFYRDSNSNLIGYKLFSGTDSESSPGIIRPTDYNGSTNQKVWKLINRNHGNASAPATSGTMSINATGIDVLNITPTNNCTFNLTGGTAGQRLTFVIITSGTSSYTMTFGTALNSSGTLTTGTVDQIAHTVTFLCINGGDFVEISRTTGITYTPLV